MTRAIRAVGWMLVIAGAVALLYVVYLLWFTGLGTDREQRDLAEQFTLLLPEIPSDGDDDPDPDDGAPDDGAADEETPTAQDDVVVELGEAYAAIWFERDGERVVTDDVLYTVEGVSLDVLRRGPGHYPDSDRPGGSGNFAIAGHRTTYGSPFWALDELEPGDTIHVVDRAGREWIYAFVEQRIVQPSDIWVVGDDPLGAGRPMITLTTCHPRFSAAQRLIAWGELVGEPATSTDAAADIPNELPQT